MKIDPIYPLFLRSVTRDYVWGGTKLGERYGKGSGPIAESWELCGESTVENGEYAGKTLREVLGTDLPLLVKFLDAREALSVQVHPSDENALAPERGKEELWYVLEAEAGSFIYCGLVRDLTEAELRAASADGSIMELLHRLPVSAGDVIHILPGTVHALGAGVLTVELQQSSDTTFRLYDYGRGRELHLDRGCAVAEKRAGPPRLLHAKGGAGLTEILRTENFRLRELVCGSSAALCAENWQHLLVLEGESRLCRRGKAYGLHPGASVFLPEGFGEYTVEGACRVLITDN